MKKGILVALFLAGMWLVLLAIANFASGSNTLTCTRASNQCVLARRPTLLLGHEDVRFTVQQFRGARLESNGSRSRRIVFDIDAGGTVRAERLTAMFVSTRTDGSRDAMDADLERANAFASGGVEMLQVDDGGDTLTPLLVAGGVGLLATFVVLRGVATGRRRR
jgi:hypothetical protein